MMFRLCTFQIQHNFENANFSIDVNGNVVQKLSKKNCNSFKYLQALKSMDEN